MMHIPSCFKIFVFNVLSRIVCLHGETKVFNKLLSPTIDIYDKNKIKIISLDTGDHTGNGNKGEGNFENDTSYMKILRILQGFERRLIEQSQEDKSRDERRLMAKIVDRFLFIVFLIIITTATSIFVLNVPSYEE